MAKIIGVISARMSSKRLPGKVMKKIAGKSVFAHHVERMRTIEGIDGVFLATSTDSSNEELISEAERLGCGWYAGSEQDVVKRHIGLCEREAANAFLRVPCDSPLFDCTSLSTFIKEFKKQFWDYIYVSNLPKPQGVFKELISYEALLETHKHYKGSAIANHIVENPNDFKCLGVEMDSELCRPEYRLALDYAYDFEMIEILFEALYQGGPLDLFDVYEWLDDNPQIAQINRGVEISNVNKYFANLMHNPLYSIVRHGERHVVLDRQKQIVEPREFINKIYDLFPELNQ